MGLSQPPDGSTPAVGENLGRRVWPGKGAAREELQSPFHRARLRQAGARRGRAADALVAVGRTWDGALNHARKLEGRPMPICGCPRKPEFYDGRCSLGSKSIRSIETISSGLPLQQWM